MSPDADVRQDSRKVREWLVEPAFTLVGGSKNLSDAIYPAPEDKTDCADTEGSTASPKEGRWGRSAPKELGVDVKFDADHYSHNLLRENCEQQIQSSCHRLRIDTQPLWLRDDREV